jgi:hypothetical protein
VQFARAVMFNLTNLDKNLSEGFTYHRYLTSGFIAQYQDFGIAYWKKFEIYFGADFSTRIYELPTLHQLRLQSTFVTHR